MPQLNKGGKFIFGFSVIRPDGTVCLPPQAVREYGLEQDETAVIFTGSKVTGGFCVTARRLLAGSKLSHILAECPSLADASAPEGVLAPYKGRRYAWLRLGPQGQVRLPPELLAALELHPGMELLSIRSSDIAFTMGAKGPLLARAYAYPGAIGRY